MTALGEAPNLECYGEELKHSHAEGTAGAGEVIKVRLVSVKEGWKGLLSETLGKFAKI